ncbi:11741_t:CDS:2, partial [Gigaspora margarita]
MSDLQNKKADITYAQLFQVVPNIRKEIAKITRAERIVISKIAEYCVKMDKKNNFNVLRSTVNIAIDHPSTVVIIGVYGEQKQPLGEVNEFPVTVREKTISSCAVVTDTRNYAEKIRIPTEYCKPMNINERIENKKKPTKVKKKLEKDVSILEEETKLKSDKSDSGEEYKEEVLNNKLYLYWKLREDKGDSMWCPEYETIYLNEKKEKEDFNIGPMTGKQEEQLRAILLKYKGTFQEESSQLEKTFIAQHKIYTKDGLLVKQKFYPTFRPEYEFIKTEEKA